MPHDKRHVVIGAMLVVILVMVSLSFRMMMMRMISWNHRRRWMTLQLFWQNEPVMTMLLRIVYN